jgi:hypothetical protein
MYSKILWLDILVFGCGRLNLIDPGGHIRHSFLHVKRVECRAQSAYWNEGCRVQVKADIGVIVCICAFVRISTPQIFSLGHCANKRWLAQEMLSRRRTPPGNTCFTHACRPFRTRCSWPDLHFLRLFTKLTCMFQLVFAGRLGTWFQWNFLLFLFMRAWVRARELEITGAAPSSSENA